MKSKCYFCNEKYDDYIDFINTDTDYNAGELHVSTYSYEIASCGQYKLNKEETKQLFLAMYDYYCRNNDKFWENV